MGLLKKAIYKAAGKAFLPLFRSQNIFPYYHILSEKPALHIQHLYPFKTAEQFRKDLEILLRHYRPLDPLKLNEGIRRNNGFLLTFDDGLVEMYTTVYPILKEKGISAVFFLNPTVIDQTKLLYKHSISLIISLLKERPDQEVIISKIETLFNWPTAHAVFYKRLKSLPFVSAGRLDTVFELLDFDLNDYISKHPVYMSKKQLVEMSENGFFFGGHTMNHPPFDEITEEQQITEITDSIRWVKSNLDVNYSFFAFPFSDRGISRSVIEQIFQYDQSTIIFGNAGIRKDIDQRIIQRFSVERPDRKIEKLIVTENIYKLLYILTGKYNLKRT